MSKFRHREVGRHRGQAIQVALAAVLLSPQVGGAQDAAPSAPPAAEVRLGTSETRATVGETQAREWGEDYQIRVTGGAPYTRVKFTVFTNEFREDFRWLLFRLRPNLPGARMAWTVPIQVELWGEEGDVHKGDDLITRIQIGPDNRFLIRLETKLHDAFSEEDYRRELLRALLIEQVIAPFASDPSAFPLERVDPPAWLVEGFDQLIQHRRQGSPSAFYRGFLASGQMLKPAEIFAVAATDSFDPVKLAIFRASSSAMVEALLDQADGDESLRGVLGDLGRPEPVPTEVLLRQHFPGFREMEGGLEKWWALEVASLGQQQRFEYLGREDTERLLDEALLVRFEGAASEREGAGDEFARDEFATDTGGTDEFATDEFATDAVAVATGSSVPEEAPKRGLFDFLKPKKPSATDRGKGKIAVEPFLGSMDQYALFIDRPGAKEQIEAAYSRLLALERVGFPLYRPVFNAYERLFVKLQRGEVKDLPAEFEAVAEMRTKVRETLVRTEDYLNFFEATRAPSRSDAFDSYLELRRALDEKPPPSRRDAITRHLDALEREFR